MIIQSIRLKNIKCYGDGPDGQGTTVEFQSGINRIGGRNGHGKSTLIESLGYALFLAEPAFEDRFELERYFLSYGSKEGEIDVTFASAEGCFRVERGVGKASKRRPKVVQLSDGSICAENEREVRNFLCNVLRFPDASRLTEMFSKLIGVRQGRLTWPFDSKAREAKEFFEPLLDVAIFRQCFDELKPTVDLLQDQQHQDDTRRAELGAKVNDRADSEQKVVEGERQIEQSGAGLNRASAAREVAAARKQQLEQLEGAARLAATKAESYQHEFQAAAERRALAEKAVQESQAAGQKVQENQAAYDAYRAATGTLTDLQQQRVTRDVLTNRRAERQRAASTAAARAMGLHKQVAEFAKLKTEKEQQASDLQNAAAPLAEQVQVVELGLAQGKAAAQSGQNAMAIVARVVAGLGAKVTAQEKTATRIGALANEVATWDEAALEYVRQREETARIADAEAKESLAKAQAQLKSLEKQLKDIAGGLCPFLKEQCRQFDPAKVSADVTVCRAELQQFQAAAKASETSNVAAHQAHEKLKATHGQVMAKRAQLRDDLEQYVQPLATLLLPEAARAAAALTAWEAGVPALPVLGAALAPSNPEGVRAIQQRLNDYVMELECWWKESEVRCKARLENVRAEELAVQAQVQKLASVRTRIAELGREIQSLQNRVAVSTQEAGQHEREQKAAEAETTTLEEQLKPHANVDGEWSAQQQKQTASQSGYEAWLQARDVAAQVDSRRAALADCSQKEEAAQFGLEAARSVHRDSVKAFDPAALAQTNAEFQARSEEVARVQERVEAQKQELAAQKARLAEWQAARTELQQVLEQMDRRQAAIELTEWARKILRDSASEVARHHCRCIASEAQRVFNQISLEPITLEWDSSHYSLEIAPGARRFAMRSGGEQTKLALAMTLAMIEQFCGLRFCVFDEPTYGVDADSRRKLAETIVEVQKAAGLEQLLLVSHDDAFEGTIEHSIVLSKTAIGGTDVLRL